MKKEIDYKRLKGQDLLDYFIIDHHDRDYSSIVSMLPYATMSLDEAYALLERSVREDKRFVVVYPEIKKADTSKMEYIGSVTDGGLYLE